MDFTKSQQLAIELRDRNILVSAAAGSGKTATLTERILQLLIDESAPANIDSMLIVTFTRAAAGELRTRISKKLGEALADNPANTHIAKQITSLPSAKICTIDSYYLDLIKRNFQKLGIPARFRLADETELQIMRYEVMNAVIERRYETDPDFSPFADEITTAKGENQLAEILLNIWFKIQAFPEGTNILESSADKYSEYSDKDLFTTPIGLQVHQGVTEKIQYLIRRANRILEMLESEPAAAPYGKAISSDLDFLNQFQDALNKFSYVEARKVIYDYAPVTLGRVSGGAKSDITEEIKNERNEIKEALIKLREKEFCSHPDDLSYICRKSAQMCTKTREILDDFNNAYVTEKSSRSICEFADLRRYALQLLVDSNGEPTQTAIEEQGKYQHIFVDEYQDTDNIQDLVFRTISNGRNLFFVGDIKQSIYSFRGANPSVFSSYRRSYLPAEGNKNIPSAPLSVFMSENFRCSPNIISFTNSVCSYLFRETEGEGCGIGYVAEDDLIASRSEPISTDKVKVVLLDKDSEEETVNSECAFVISEIRSMLKNKIKPDGEPYLPRDIAILTRSNKEASRMANALAQAGIPHANSTGDDLFENPEVLLMLSLLSVSDNPQRDIPLAAVLRSPIFNFNLDELIKIRSGRYSMSLFDAVEDYANSDGASEELKLKCISAIDRISYYRTEAESLPVHTFMRFLWKDTSALSYAGSDKSSQKRTPIERRRNLRKFYEYARRYEASSYKGLHDFVEYINGIISQNTKIAEEDAVTENTVRIMTVHKSKGLEFPAVFLTGCEKSTDSRDSRSGIIFEPSCDVALAFKISDSTGFGQLDTPFRIALANKVSQLSSEEEIRILYVALTRARDNLCIIASGKEGSSDKIVAEATVKSTLGGRLTVLSSSSWIDRIMLGLKADARTAFYTIETPLISGSAESQEVSCEEYVPDEEMIEEIYNKIRPSLEFKYKDSYNSLIPAKVSVSRLYPELLNETDTSYDISKKIDSMDPRKPRFMGEEATSADKGTATHLFMQFCDFSRLTPSVSSIEEEIARLIELKFLPDNISKLIRTKELAAFASSKLLDVILKANKIHREFRFNVFLPAEDFTDIPDQKIIFAGEKILVQGVIDLCIEDANGNLILCDYKTDRLSSEALKDRQIAKQFLTERHAQQLKYYALAIELIMGKKPDKIYIYSLALGDTIEIDL